MITKPTTNGTFFGCGEDIIIVDDYANPNCAHRILANAWIGTTRRRRKKVPLLSKPHPPSAPCGRTWTAIVKNGTSEKG